MKTFKKIITGSFVAAAMFGTTSAYAQTTEAQLRANLNAQLRVLLIQLVEKLQAELVAQKQSGPETVDKYQYKNLDGEITYDIDSNKVEVTVSGEYNNGCSVALQPTIKKKNKVFDINLLERTKVNVPCTLAIVPYELNFDINTKDLDSDTYTVKINGVKEFTFDIDNDDGVLPIFANDSISAHALSSSSSTPSDTASFKFTINVNPFSDPIYVPVSAANSINFDVTDASTDLNVNGPSTVSLTSSASRVNGNDSNEYYKLSSSKRMTVTVTTKPGSGDYFATLDSIKFTNQNITDSSFTGFSPIKINLSDDVWRTEVITLLN